MFNRAYMRVLSQHMVKVSETSNMLQVESLADGRLINTAHTQFVDDISTSIASYNIYEIPHLITTLNHDIDQHFNVYGFKQNLDKMQIILDAHGPGARELEKHMAKKFGI
eukprot:2479489-Karenia_brevis.AAC.1